MCLVANVVVNRRKYWNNVTKTTKIACDVYFNRKFVLNLKRKKLETH